MTTYLLLRNNKESGPYTLDELKAKGLKAYDLVWVEGKSAAWRYPSEVEELKKFAPIVEEQPYDRFYKKTSQPQQPAVQEPANNNAYTEKEKPKTAPAEQAVVVNLDNKNVYVTMPAGQTFVAAKEPARSKDPSPREFVQKTYAPLPAETGKITEEPAINKTDLPRQQASYFSDPEPSRNSYPEKNIAGAKRKSNNKYLLPVLIGVCTLLLLAVGIFIGMQLSNSGRISTKKEMTNTQDGADKLQTTQTQLNSKSADPLPAEKNDKFLDSVATIVAASNKASAENKANGEKKKTAVQKFQPSDSLEALQKKITEDSSSGFTITHRESTHRDEPATDPSPKINLADYVSVSANKYTIGTFGGISDLQLTVKNQSTYPLDLAVVEVQYIQANKKIFKTENLYFHNVAPGSVLMQEAPKSPRGIKVQYRLTLVNSKQNGLSYSGI